MATAVLPSESLDTIRRYSHRYVLPTVKVRYFARLPAAHVAVQQVYTIPFVPAETQLPSSGRVVLMIHNDTIAEYWLRQLAGSEGGNCEVRTETVADAMQRCLLLRMAMVVVVNAWCDVSTRETEHELHYVSEVIAKARLQ